MWLLKSKLIGVKYKNEIDNDGTGYTQRDKELWTNFLHVK